jgi:hypothetical protein
MPVTENIVALANLGAYVAFNVCLGIGVGAGSGCDIILCIHF